MTTDITTITHSRRDVIRMALAAAGFTTLAGTGTLLTACAITADRRLATGSTLFGPDRIEWLDEVAETILPATATPGAKAAAVGAFIALMVTDTYSPDEQALFMDGMTRLEAACVRSHGRGFLAADAGQRLALLGRLDREAYDHGLSAAAEDPPHYFRMLKELTVLGFFTSEIGYTQTMRYVESPGRWDPCVDYSPGERAWARHA
jgi:hypothetical protein